MKIELPNKKGAATNPILDFAQLVVIGANGSGKTRFGSWIEQRYPDQTHRISAQKSLSFPKEVSPTSKKRAEIQFHAGWYNDTLTDAQLLSQKTGQRWGGNLNTFLLNDYEKLMVLLHTEEYEESLNFKEGRIGKPVTKLDKVQRIWEAVLPHRKLLKRAGIIETCPSNNQVKKYNASEMSDGERVIFYLIGEVVCTKPNSIVVIDEPESHIHRSLVKSLFDLIEAERPDCSFVYLTHDIDFAFARQNATKIWTKSYDEGDIWDYEILADHLPIPEQLYLEVLGSRKPIIFLEGESSSIDYELYEQVYLSHTVKPLGSCDKVIQTVKAFNEQTGFHHLESFGIIDRDRRQTTDIPKLNAAKIWVLDVAEAENLLLLEGIVKVVASHMGRNGDAIFDEVKKNLIAFFKAELDAQILIHFKELLRRKLITLTNFSSQDITSVVTEVDNSYKSVDKLKLHGEIRNEFETVVSKSDYEAVLRFFNLKGALVPQSKVCELTGIRNKEEYRKLVVTILKKKDTNSEKIRTAIDNKIIKNAS
jgi:hypothetical protein